MPLVKHILLAFCHVRKMYEMRVEFIRNASRWDVSYCVHCNWCDAPSSVCHLHVHLAFESGIYGYFCVPFYPMNKFNIPLLTWFVHCSHTIGAYFMWVCILFESNDRILKFIRVRLTEVLFAMSKLGKRDKCDERHTTKSCNLRWLRSVRASLKIEFEGEKKAGGSICQPELINH